MAEVVVNVLVLLQKRGSEKGRIDLQKMKVVERVDASAFEKPYAFQVS